MSFSPEFTQAAEDALNLQSKPSQENMLKLYGLYKRVTLGLPPSQEPNRILHPRENAKWRSWDSMKRYSRRQAETMYIELVKSLQNI